MSLSPERVAKYMELFVARDDMYARGFPDDNKPWKYRYHKVEASLTPQVLETHLAGDETFGVYCETVETQEARWFAVDFDAPKDENDHAIDGGFEIALEEARRSREALLDVGLLTYLERSRSGSGVHLWGFLSDWTDARQLADIVDRLLPEGLKTVDKGKRYPPLRASKTSLLICMPYAGQAVELGNSMFLDPDDLHELTADEFLDTVRVNPVSVLGRVVPDAAKATAPKSVASVGTTGAAKVVVTEWAGRPDKVGTGIIKMLSPFGCGFMRGVWLNQHDRKLVGEREWYAFLGQLSAFKHGRDAAHAIFAAHKFYDARGCDAKFDHALANPPNGCAFIHENFPQFQCKGCPMTAPYRTGYRTITEMVGESPQELERALYDTDLERIRRLDASEDPEGIPSGIPGTDHLFRFQPGQFVAIGAQPSIGKTALAVHIGNTVAALGTDVAIFSAESGPVSLHDRQIAWRSGVDSYALKGLRATPQGMKLPLTSQEWERIEEATQWLRQLPLWENYTTTSPERIYDAIEGALCRRRKPLTKPFLTLFDYFQYAEGSEESAQDKMHVRLGRASFNLKSITKITEHPLAALAQLIRESEGDDDPKMNWWRGTARLEHDIDAGIIMTGDRMPGRFAPRAAHGVKNREGQVGWKVDLLLEQAISKFQGKPGSDAQKGEELIAGPWDDKGQMSVAGKQ